MIPETDGGRVEHDVIGTAEVHAVSEDQAPARPGRPGGLRQGLEPGSVVRQGGEIRVEQELEPPFGAGQRDRPDRCDYQQHEEARDQNLVRPFDALHHPLKDDEAAEQRSDHVEQDRPPPRLHIRAPVFAGLHAAELARERGDEILQRPPGDDRVVEENHHRHDSDPAPHPGVPGSHEPGEGADDPPPHATSNRELRDQEWQRPGEEKDHPGNQEGSAAVLRGNAREPPQVPRADSHSETGRYEPPPR